MVERLLRGPASVTELAQPHGMSLPGFMKHLRLPEHAGLVIRSKEGRVVNCELAAETLREAARWLAHYEQFRSRRLDALGRYLDHQEEIQAWAKTTRPGKTPASASPATTGSRPRRSGGKGPTRKR